ncbi:DUF4097 family beta strand repeat-containing protein [Tumebacillus permanentifrigoris]|uniref:Putative adhesin n=1 Tax=Tumebacillus permanentifrigoris TaxID=378543 RepID=A0A316DCB7_9BACL|nr:DUF4097 family beta strand repeat-containing protein [Tumebacillus permanentifrigoris]PWK15787.1 putative adhesin [Tumebacillus permanentifrigoris]
MKRNNMGSKVTMGFAVLALAATMVGCSSTALTGKESSLDLEKSFDGKDVTSLQIQSSAAEIHLIPIDGDKIQVSLKGTLGEKDIEKEKDTMLNATLSGSQLTIIAKKPSQFLNLGTGKLQLDVQVPKKVYNSIKLESSSGDITVDPFEAKQFTIDVQSGNTKVAGFKGDEFIASAQSGNMKFDKMSGHVNVTVQSGDVSLSMAEMLKDVSVETHSGDTRVFLPETSAVRVDVEAKSADSLKLGLPLTTQTNDKQHIVGMTNNASGNAPLLKVSSHSGDFELGKVSN